MSKKIFFLIVVMIIIISPNNVSASTVYNEKKIPVISDTYKEGFYSFDNSTNVDIGVMLLNNTPTKIVIFDNEMNIEVLMKVPYNQKIRLYNIEPNRTIGIVGEGEVVITFEPSK